MAKADFYVGNGTKQNLSFMYWIPGVGGKKLTSKVIRPGRQVQLEGDLDQQALDALILTSFKYGLRHMNEIGGTTVISMIFNQGGPIPSRKLQELVRHNHNVMVLRGKKIRAEAAVLNSQIWENNDQENGLAGDRPVKTEMLEEFNPNMEREEAPMSEGYDVDPKAPEFPGMPPAQKRAKRPLKKAA